MDDLFLNAAFYVVLGFVSLGIALMLVGLKHRLPFRGRLKAVEDKKLVVPFFLIIFGLSLLVPLFYPYAHFVAGSTPKVSQAELANSVAVGFGEAGKGSGKGMDGAIVLVPSVKLKTKVKDTLDKVELQQVAGHVPWTALPGEKGTMMILGENYMHQLNGGPNVLFTTLHLVKPKAKVEVYFNKKKYEYRVRETRVISPDELEPLAKKGAKERLILVTCYPPGTQVNRFVVFADPIPRS